MLLLMQCAACPHHPRPTGWRPAACHPRRPHVAHAYGRPSTCCTTRTCSTTTGGCGWACAARVCKAVGKQRRGRCRSCCTRPYCACGTGGPDCLHPARTLACMLQVHEAHASGGICMRVHAHAPTPQPPPRHLPCACAAPQAGTHGTGFRECMHAPALAPPHTAAALTT